MRILLLNQFFQPEPFFKALPFAKKLRERGFEVEALTGFPNYPGGVIYKGYKVRAYQCDNLDGIVVHRTALYPNHGRAALGRIVNYSSFGLSSLVLGVRKLKPFDVVYCYNLVTLIFAAIYLRRRDGTKIVYDVQDLWPESVCGSGMMGNGILLKVLRFFCDWVYKQADHVCVLSPGFKRNLMSRGVSEGRISVVYNWCDNEAPCQVVRDCEIGGDYGVLNTFNVVYAGNMGSMQSLDTLLDCAKLIRGTMPDVRILLVGGGVERSRLERRVTDEEIENIVFLPRQPQEKMARIYSLADAVVVHLRALPVFEITIPSKTQAYMASGLPILMGVRGDASELILDSGGGFVFTPESPVSLCDVISQLRALSVGERKKMGDNNRNYYMKYLSKDVGVSRFSEIFREVTGGCGFID